MRSTLRHSWLLFLAPLLLASKCRPDDEVVDTNKTPIDVNVKLQVAGVDPAFGVANKSFDAEVFGAAFEKGATVQVGGAAATSVEYAGSSSISITVPALPAGSWDLVVTNPGGASATLRRAVTLSESSGPSCPKALVYFDLDSSSLTPAARSQLDALVACARTGTMSLRVEGHCDARGTTEYNLALGQRRADAVGRYLVGLGISPGRVASTSYGEERLADTGSGATADALNRRAEVYVK